MYQFGIEMEVVESVKLLWGIKLAVLINVLEYFFVLILNNFVCFCQPIIECLVVFQQLLKYFFCAYKSLSAVGNSFALVAL